MNEISLADAQRMSPAQRAGAFIRLLDPDGDRTGHTSLVPAAAYEQYIAKGFRPLEPVTPRKTVRKQVDGG